jgi:hypothetical protein
MLQKTRGPAERGAIGEPKIEKFVQPERSASEIHPLLKVRKPVTRVFIEPRGARYRVRLYSPDGMILAEASAEPLFDAARVLLAKGISGEIEMHDMPRPDCAGSKAAGCAATSSALPG